MEIGFNRGIVVSDGSKKILLDPETTSSPIGIPTFISHAHSDHTAGLRGSSISHCTPETIEIYEQVNKKPGRNVSALPFYEPINVGELEIEFIPAGHLLGAAQVVVRHGEESLIYTGDFCPEDLISVPKADLPKDNFDVCIVETTYGKKSLKFPPRSTSRVRILQFIMMCLKSGATPVINISQVGGAQELILFLNQMTKDLPIYVDEKIFVPSMIYKSHNPEMKFTNLDNFDKSESSVVLLSRATKKVPKCLTGKEVKRGIVSGQVSRFGFSRYDFTVPLSTHATYNELLQMIQSVKPSKIFTHYSYADDFASHLRNNFGINASPIKVLKDRMVPVRDIADSLFFPAHNGPYTIDDFF